MKKGWFLHLCLFPFISFVSFVCVAGCESSSMCFSEKLLMERILLLAILPGLLLADPANFTAPNTTLTVPKTPHTASSAHENIRITTPTTTKLPPELFRLKVYWDKKNVCQGKIVHFTGKRKTKGLCANPVLRKLSMELCEERRCGKFLEFSYDLTADHNGHMINDNLIPGSSQGCEIVSNVICEGNNELLTYKVITGLLLVLILAVLLFRFARPAYNAFRKRFSKKHQNRWIGPTQSQSVSYHRGQGLHLKADTGKRQSYPGLEIPSSNRNSEYDSYSYT